MPIYQFRCNAGHETDAIVRFNVNDTYCKAPVTRRGKADLCNRLAHRTDTPQLVARRDPILGIQK
jgi:hypothetical protein